jgi:type IV pilus assembly protein PilA
VRTGLSCKPVRWSGFTLVELMIVILIVAILAAVMLPMMRARINSAKWSEGMTGAGTIADAVRAYAVQVGHETTLNNASPTLDEIGLPADGLRGKYFRAVDYGVTGLTYDRDTGAIQYTVSISCPPGVSGGPLHLDATGAWDWNGNPP